MRLAFTTAHQLNGLEITGRKYTVVRDPSSQRFKIEVIDRESGIVLDQFPPEDILQMLAHLSSAVVKYKGEDSK